MDVRVFLDELMQGRRPAPDAVEHVFEQLLSGGLDPAQIGALLALLPPLSIDVGTLTAAARVMRRHVTRVPFAPAPGESLVDTCGTGGAAKTFNISTAAAIVAASARPEARSGVRRVIVAKHGNRSRTGRGSAEVLAALGVNVDASPETQARCLRECGVCFCFAIHHHPSMRHVAGPRRALGVPTIFNLLGPLTNPAGAERQLIGVYAPQLVPIVGEALAHLGAADALVAHGDGMDELTTTGSNIVSRVRRPQSQSFAVEPGRVGLAVAQRADLEARDVGHAAEMVRHAIAPGASGPAHEIVLLNAAAALLVAGTAEDLGACVELAREAVGSGRAQETLSSLSTLSRD